MIINLKIAILNCLLLGVKSYVDWSSKEFYDDDYLNETILQDSIKCRYLYSDYMDIYFDRIDEYRNRPGVLTLFRKGTERFYCETRCPLGMKAGCNRNTTDGSMEITPDCPKMAGDYRKNRLKPSPYCPPFIPYLLRMNYPLSLDFSNSIMHETHVENPPYTNVSWNHTLTCSKTVKCPPDYFCAEAWNTRTRFKDMSHKIGIPPMYCVKFPTPASKEYGNVVPCKEDNDCLETGIVSKCTTKLDFKINNEDTESKGLCEFVKQIFCTIGKPVLPSINCTESYECGEGAWCDMDIHTCCKENPEAASELHYCPDGVTPIQQEPSCVNNTEGHEVCMISKNGAEPQQQGICWSGKCCPELQRKSEDKYVIGDLQYQSAVHCHSFQPLPFKYAYKWCDDKTGRIHTIGTHDYEHKNMRSVRVNCKINRDCPLKSQICLNLVNKRRVCYYHPEKQPETASRYLFYGKLIGPILWIIAIAFFVEKYL